MIPIIGYSTEGLQIMFVIPCQKMEKYLSLHMFLFDSQHGKVTILVNIAGDRITLWTPHSSLLL